MEDNITKVTDQIPSRGIAVSSYGAFQILEMFLQVQQEALYLVDIFQSVHFKFIDLCHPGAVEDHKVTALPISTGQNHSKNSILPGLGDIFSATFQGGTSGDQRE